MSVRLKRSTVPFVDLVRLAPVKELRAAVQGVVNDGRYVNGPAVAEFEAAFARYCGSAHCVGVSSGTSALQAALLACGVRPGDEVITVSATFVATTAAIVNIGAIPVFVDIDPIRRTCDPELVRAAIGPHTAAIVPVDLYGQPADLPAIRAIAREHRLAVVADSAQAHGARLAGRRVGSLADATCFSFYPTKNLGAVGDAGAVTTDHFGIAERIRELRDHGRGAHRNQYIRVGQNWRLDTLQAAVLLVKLPRLDDWNRLRRQAAARYADLLGGAGLELPAEHSETEHVFHLYVVCCRDRDMVRRALAARGVDVRVHYPSPVHLTEPFRRYASTASLAASAALGQSCLSLPLFPGITETEQAKVADAVREVLRRQQTDGGSSICRSFHV